MTRDWQIGVDIGGTFTDVVAVSRARDDVRAAKVRSVAGEPIASLQAALAAVDLDWSEISDLMHGTTLATNAMVEGKIARVALIATEGFRDVLAIGRMNRADLYRLDVLPKLPPTVPDALRFEVSERMDSSGEVLVPLGEVDVDRVIDEAVEAGAQAVAVSLLHAYANPAHEEALGARLTGRVEHVALSHRLNPEAREYERTGTTVLNAALMPLTAGYLDWLLARSGKTTRVHLFHSAGGMAAPAAVKERPLALALSGPAAGVAAASRIARELKLSKVISFDMGGTTTDVCLVVDGAAQISSDRTLAGHTLRQPMVAVESIGAGGGSIARIDSGAFRVGPDSAGAEPGPACYGAGAGVPTVTDANLLLGFLAADRRLGGEIDPDRALAERAIAPLADSFGVSVAEAARGIHQVANANMARALRRVTVERGVDARECALVAYGGAGPMHAVELAREFGIARVVVPHLSSMFSALGCLTAELAYAQQQTVGMMSEAWDAERVGALSDALVAQLETPLRDAGYETSDIGVEHIAAVRYAGQSYAVEIACAPPFDVHRVGADFTARHRTQYGFATDEPWELQYLRVRLYAAPVARARPPVDRVSGAVAPRGATPCWFDDELLDTPRFAREGLAGGHRIAGPAIIEDDWSTVVINPGAAAWVETGGHLLIDAGGAP